MILGGNKIYKVSQNNLFNNLNGKNYFYNLITLKPNTKFNIDSKKHFCLLNLSKTKYLIEYKKNKKNIFDQVVISKNCKVSLQSQKPISLLFCGKISNSKSSSIVFKNRDKIYKVEKPWGYELWINKGSKKFCFKEIFIKKGFKTSLQFHKFKTETNFIFSGKCKLYYSLKSPKKFNPALIKTKILNKFNSIFVKPNTIHRIEALTNIKLFEVSTPNLSDVIRLKDDSNRPSGKIKSEHKKNNLKN
jgi:mannose-6-phosphate isomerase-like protein (cupin superfamily)